MISTGGGSIKASQLLSDSLRDTEIIAGGNFNVDAASVSFYFKCYVLVVD